MSKRRHNKESPVADDVDENEKRRKLVTEQHNGETKGLNRIGRAIAAVDRSVDPKLCLTCSNEGKGQAAGLGLIDRSADLDLYIDSAFPLARTNEVLMFLQYEYIVLSYDPASLKKDQVITGPHMICEGFPALEGPEFSEYGVDAAFGCHGGNNEAFIFSINYCAKIKYLPDTQKGEVIINTTMTTRMFPFLKGTNFRILDAAFESMVIDEAYLFKGPEYAIINYSKSKGSLIDRGLIRDAFPCLRNTVFESAIGAAFASHRPNEVYLFKDNSYALLHYTPSEIDSYIIASADEIVPTNWPSLRDILPRKNAGLDCYGEPYYDPPCYDA